MHKNHAKGIALLALASLVIATLPASAASPKRIDLAAKQYDLDGDGKTDDIAIHMLEAEAGSAIYNCEVAVNGLTTTLELAVPEGKINVIDIDKNDKRKEIALSERGYSDDGKTFFVGFDGKRVYRIGEVEGMTGKTDAKLSKDSYYYAGGDGKVVAPMRASLLQTWSLRKGFALSKSGNANAPYTLKAVKESVYTSTSQNTVKVAKPLKAYDSMSANGKTRTIAKGAALTLTGSDDIKWVRFQESSGKVGYLLMTDFHTIHGQGSATNFLNGLRMAD